MASRQHPGLHQRAALSAGRRGAHAAQAGADQPGASEAHGGGRGGPAHKAGARRRPGGRER